MPNNSEVLTLQYLRAIAAMAVVYYHVGLGIRDESKSISQLGACGVDLFFVISGFIMYYISSFKPMTPWRFAGARFLRIVPIYWLATLTMFLMPVVSKTIGWSSSLDIRHLATSLFFIGGMHWTGMYGTFPVYRAGWTINYEIFFYVLFSLGLFLNSVRRTAIAVCLVLSLLVAVGISYQIEDGILGFYTAPIVIEFIFGMAIAAGYRAGWRLQWSAALVSISVGVIALMIWADTPDGRLWALDRGIPAALIVVGSVSLESSARNLPIPIIRLIGDSSYSIYLTHLFTLPLLGILWNHAFTLSSHMVVIRYAVPMTAAAAVGVGVYWAVERPLHRWSRRVTSVGGLSIVTSSMRTSFEPANYR
jgi:exopolysaccharide production protein ExoZ